MKFMNIYQNLIFLNHFSLHSQKQQYQDLVSDKTTQQELKQAVGQFKSSAQVCLHTMLGNSIGLTLCLLVLSADNLCKQFGLRSAGPTLYSRNNFSGKLILKNHAKLPSRQ